MVKSELAMQVFISNIQGEEAHLREDESFHCARVVRKKVGDAIVVIDGKGFMSKATLVAVHDKKSVAKLDGAPLTGHQRDYYLQLCIAPTKHVDRTEWMLEKCIELGLDEISFFTSGNSERVHLKRERMVKIAESAVKQSLQAHIPVISDLIKFSDSLRFNQYDEKYIAHCGSGLKTELKSLAFAKKRTLVLIGPEGDFTPEEIPAAEAAGFKSLSLGENRLRTETAGLIVCAAAALS